MIRNRTMELRNDSVEPREPLLRSTMTAFAEKDRATPGDLRKTRVLIVDDHPIFRSGLAAIISDQPDLDLVGDAGCAREAFQLFQRLQPDVVVVDLSLPDMDGIDVIAALKKFDPSKQYIVLTARTGSDDINRAIAVGAHAYLFKDTGSTDLLAAIRIVAEGGRYIPPPVGRRAAESPELFELTERERGVLLWMARGLTNEKIGSALEIAPETVKSHVKNIISKLRLQNRSEVVAFCLRAGLVHVENI